MDKKLRPIPAGLSLVVGMLLTTNSASAAVTDFDVTAISTYPAAFIENPGEQIEPYIAIQQSANLTSLTYQQNDTETPDILPTPVPAPAAAWLFGSGLIGLLGLGRKRKKH